MSLNQPHGFRHIQAFFGKYSRRQIRREMDLVFLANPNGEATRERDSVGRTRKKTAIDFPDLRNGRLFEDEGDLFVDNVETGEMTAKPFKGALNPSAGPGEPNRVEAVLEEGLF